jgi:hypothetical protein
MTDNNQCNTNHRNNSSLQDDVLDNVPHYSIQPSKRKRDEKESTSTHKGRFQSPPPFPPEHKMSRNDPFESKTMFFEEKTVDSAELVKDKTEERHIHGPRLTATAAKPGSPLTLFRGPEDEDTRTDMAMIETTFASSNDQQYFDNHHLNNKVIRPPPGFARLPTGKTPGRKIRTNVPMDGNNSASISNNGPFSYGISLRLENIFLSSAEQQHSQQQQQGGGL